MQSMCYARVYFGEAASAAPPGMWPPPQVELGGISPGGRGATEKQTISHGLRSRGCGPVKSSNLVSTAVDAGGLIPMSDSVGPPYIVTFK